MSGATFDTVVVRWASGELTVGTPAAENNLEGFIEDASLTSIEQAVEFGTQWLALHGATVDQTNVGINPQRDAVTPFTGLSKGDAVDYENRAGGREVGRIHSRGFTGLRRNGRADWAITIGTRRQEASIAAQRQLARIGGSMRSSFASATPSPAPSFGDLSTSALPSMNLPVADTDLLSTEEPYDRTAPYRFTESAAVVRLQCQAESIVPDNPLDDPGDWTYTDSVLAIYKITYSGADPTATELEQFTWPGDSRLYQLICDHPYATDESYQLRTITAGSHRLLSIQPVGSSLN